MSEIIITILSSAATTTVLVAILTWTAQNWMGERIKGSISSEYARELELHKAEHARQLELFKSEYAHKLETHKASHAHELESRKAELKATFDIDLERLRAEITQERKTQEVAIAAFATAHNAAIERKLRAVETLWDATRKSRTGASRLFWLFCSTRGFPSTDGGPRRETTGAMR